jgi:O-antigen/teichoic acid export membrane protein
MEKKVVACRRPISPTRKSHGYYKLSLKKTLIKSFMGVGVMKLLSIPVGLATSIILARTLGPEGFGQYAFIMALIPLIALPVSGGLPQLLTREIAIFSLSKDWALYKGVLRASHGLVLIVAFSILIAFWTFGVGLHIIPTEGKWDLLPIALLIIPLAGLAAVRTGTMKGLGMPAYAEIPRQLIQPAVMLVLFGTLAWLQILDAKSAIWVQVSGAGLVFFIASWMFFKVQPSEAKGVKPDYRLKHWRNALFPFSLLAMVSAFNAQIGVIALGFLSTDEQVAAMRVAERGGQFVAMSLTLVNMVIAPYIVRAHRDRDRHLLQNLAQKSARGSFLIALPVALVLIILGEALIRISFGEDYAEIAYWPVVIVAIGQLFNVYFGSVGYLLSMSGYERDTLKGLAISVLLNLILCLFLVPIFDSIGAALAMAISMLIWNSILAFLVAKRLKIKCSAFK